MSHPSPLTEMEKERQLAGFVSISLPGHYLNNSWCLNTELKSPRDYTHLGDRSLKLNSNVHPQSFNLSLPCKNNYFQSLSPPLSSLTLKPLAKALLITIKPYRTHIPW